MKLTSLITFYKLSAVALSVTLLTACPSDNKKDFIIDNSPAPINDAAARSVAQNMPTLSKLQTSEIVTNVAEQNNSNSADVLLMLSGYWEGELSLGDSKVTVSALASSDGVISITNLDVGIGGLLITDAILTGDQFSGTVMQSNVDELSIFGELNASTLTATILPADATMEELEAGTLVVDSSNIASFGNITLTRSNLVNKLTVSELSELQWLPEEQQGFAALNIDENGNFAAVLNNCSVSGAITESPNISGALSFAVSPSDINSDCSFIPTGSAQNMANGQLLLDNNGMIVVSIQDINGDVLSTRINLADLVSGKLTSKGL
jgi:hypothetical protein